MRQLTLPDAVAVIHDAQGDGIRAGHLDPHRMPRIAHGVRNQVIEDPHELLRVRLDQQLLLRHLHLQLDAMLQREPVHVLVALLDAVREVQPLELELLPAFEPRQGQQVAHILREPRTLLRNDVRRVHVIRHDARLDALRIAADRHEWRPKIMRHILVELLL